MRKSEAITTLYTHNQLSVTVYPFVNKIYRSNSEIYTHISFTLLQTHIFHQFQVESIVHEFITQCLGR